MVIDNLENIRILITLRGAVVKIWHEMVRIAFYNVLWTDWVDI